jgi:heme-binding protein
VGNLVRGRGSDCDHSHEGKIDHEHQWLQRATRNRLRGGCLPGRCRASDGDRRRATALAAPEGCTADAVAATVSSVTGSAQQYLGSHPAANQVVTAAYGQPRPQAADDVRAYFTANPQEYYELRDILAPLGEKQRQCNVQVLPPELASAYDQFMAG